MSHLSNSDTETTPDRVHAMDSPTWFEQPAHVHRIILALGITCLTLVTAEFFYSNPHPHFPAESIFGFHAWFGFGAFVAIVFLGQLLRWIVSRPEDYYGH